MKVLHVLSGRVASGTEGITKNVDGVVAALRANGHDATLEAHTLELQDLNRRGVHFRNAWRLRQLLRAPAAESADIVHVHANIATMGLAIPKRRAAGASRRRPTILHVWNALYVSEEQPRGAPLSARLPHALANGPSLARLASSRCDAIVVASQFQRAQLEQANVTTPVFVVPNGIDGSVYRPADERTREAARESLRVTGRPTILYYGHRSYWKGMDTIVDALPAIQRGMPGAQFLFSTTAYGGAETALRDKLARNGALPRTRLLGPTNVATLLAAADVAVFPWPSPVGSACFPNVLLESMSAGLAVVATKVGCVPELVESGVSGELVAPRDAPAIAEAVLGLGLDAEKRQRIGHAARRVVEERLSWTAVASRMSKVYDEFGNPAPATAGHVDSSTSAPTSLPSQG